MFNFSKLFLGKNDFMMKKNVEIPENRLFANTLNSFKILNVLAIRGLLPPGPYRRRVIALKWQWRPPEKILTTTLNWIM